MKRNFLLLFVLITCNLLAQSNEELKAEIDAIKLEITALKSDIGVVKSYNANLKTALDLREPILEQEVDNYKFTIIKVAGNKQENKVSVELLIEALDINKRLSFNYFQAIDLKGNEFKPQTFTHTKNLTKNVPLKIEPTLINVPVDTNVFKLFKFNYSNIETFKKYNVEFRDINIFWE